MDSRNYNTRRNRKIADIGATPSLIIYNPRGDTPVEKSPWYDPLGKNPC